MENQNKKILTVGALGLASGLAAGLVLAYSPATSKKIKPAFEKIKDTSKKVVNKEVFSEERIKNILHKLLNEVLVTNKKNESDG